MLEFAGGLESVVLPVYKAAQDCGFATWEYRGMVPEGIPRIFWIEGMRSMR